MNIKNLIIVLIFTNLACTCKTAVPNIEYVDRVSTSQAEIRFGIHPLHNPEKLLSVFGPLVDYLNEKIPDYKFKLEASRNYQTFEEKLQKRELEVAIPNPFQTLKALKFGYKIFAKMGDDQNFRGLIILRKDSKIKKITDLKNKKVSYPAATALAATMLPQYFLFQNGIDVSKDIKNMYVGSQESAILNAFLKESDAGCTWPPPWIAFAKNNPGMAKELEVKWQTQSLINNGVIIRDDIPLQLREQIKSILIHLNESERGRQILQGIELSKFESAEESTYTPVKEFLEKFSREIRKPEDEN